ncbi:ABC transporter ATP-binding protein [Nocardioides sp. GXZ039]|uniref:ABC transporter ATP-binding protein n=1 Tax=Nocardioides sp. GXZ039 TaxID=3136018 RepID=UPI0030F3CE2C
MTILQPGRTRPTNPVQPIQATPGATGPQQAMLSARDVTKTYQAGSRDIEILHGISLEVRAGEMCAVMGPSGSGKSTLLYVLAGLEEPTTGEVELLGRSTGRMSRSQLAKLRRTEVGFVFQAYNLVPSLTAFENVALPMRLRGEKPDRHRIVEALATVGLADHVESRPAVMSGGEQQRVALARVLAQQPRMIFADEPTGALDSTSGDVVLEELRTIAHRPGQSVLCVTHDPQVAARSDRVLFLRDGYLVRELIAPSAEQVSDTLAEITEAQTAGGRS